MAERVSIESSVLASVLYRTQQRILEVEFRSGEFYRYFDVPQKTCDALLNAESKGAYFNANIRNRYSSSHLQHICAAGE